MTARVRRAASPTDTVTPQPVRDSRAPASPFASRFRAPEKAHLSAARRTAAQRRRGKVLRQINGLRAEAWCAARTVSHVPKKLTFAAGSQRVVGKTSSAAMKRGPNQAPDIIGEPFNEDIS